MADEDENPQEETPQLTAEEYLAQQKSSIRKKSWWGIGIGGAVVLLHLLLFVVLQVLGDQFLGEDQERISWTMLFQSMFFVLGVFGVGAGLFGLHYAKRLSLEDIIPSPEAIAFLQEGQGSRPYYSYVLLFFIIAVFLAQRAAGMEESVVISGLEKAEFFKNREYWRILTSAAMHGGFLHIYFNGQALFGIGSLFEYISNRAHLAIVFLLATVGGGLASVFLSPFGNSVGASGGIMGLIGYLAVYGYRRKQHLPPDFLKSILINVAFIAGIGIVGYQFVDNFAHLGGLIAGVVYAFVQVPRDLEKDPREAGPIATVAGMISLVGFGAGALLAILKFTNNN